MSDKKLRVSIYLTKDEKTKLESEAKKYSMPLSTMATTAIKLGLVVFDFATDPKMSKVYEKKVNDALDGIE